MDSVAMLVSDDPIKAQFVGSLEEARSTLETLPGKPIVTFNEDGHHFANMSRLTMLHHGAIRQLAREQQATISRLEARINLLESR
jgi:hypothetical protein